MNLTISQYFKVIDDNVTEAIDNLREMLQEIDGDSVGSKRIKRKIRSMLTKLEAVQKDLTED